jgi:GntR family uxuAB operon transcriptional repressor
MRAKNGLKRFAQRAVEAIKGPTDADVTLPPVSTRSSTGIAAQLRRAITDGLYAYGDRLPAEREIARSFGSSRTTVRSALRLLEERNFVRRKVGSGTFVVHSSGHNEREIADVTSPLELMDVRLAVEPHIVRLAVLHGTARDIEAMAEALSELEHAGSDRERFTHWDQRFHMALANATHNPLMVWAYHQINEVRSHTQWSKVKDKVLTPARIAEYNAEHRALFEAMQARDGETAVGIINQHLAEARHDLIGAQES